MIIEYKICENYGFKLVTETYPYLSAPIGELLQVTICVRSRLHPCPMVHLVDSTVFLQPLIVQSQYWRLSCSSTILHPTLIDT